MMDTTEPDGVNSSTPPLRVLILEDNPRDAKLTASVLEGGGFRVQFEVTDSAQFFRERLEKAEYDVILADFNLRNWTALDALEILKQSGIDIPLIMVTGFLGDEAAVECIKQGAADFVLKDRPARLPNAVQRALEEKRLRTENKRAFDAVSRLATIVESSDDAIIGGTLEGVITSWNKGAEKLFGYSAGEILGQPISVLAPPERAEEVTQILARLERGERLEHFESVRVRKDGSLVDVSLSIFPVTDSRGEVTGIASIARDVTERKRADQELHESEEQYRTLVEAAPDVIYTVSAEDGSLTSLNPAFETLTGWSRAEWLGKPFVRMVHPDDLPVAVERFQKALRGETHPPRELRVVCKSGEYLVGEFTSTQQVKDGKVVGQLAIARDITERKRAEEALRESEELYRSVVTSVAEGIMLLDRGGAIVACNRSAERILGLTTEELIGRTAADPRWQAIREDGSPLPGENFPGMAALRTGKPQSNLYMGVHKPNGSLAWTIANSVPIFHAGDGAPYVVVTSFADITERKRAEEALIEERYLLHTLMDNLPDAIYFKDRESRFTRTNKAHAKQFGLSHHAQAVGKTDFDFFTAEHAQPAYNDEQEIIRTGQPVVNKEERETWPDGRVTWVSTTKMPLRDAHGNIIGTFGVSRDITKRKLAEAENARLAVIVNSSEDAILSTTREGFIDTWNASMERLYGYAGEEIKGKHFSIFIPEDRRGDMPAYQERLLRGEALVHYELENMRKDGSRLQVSLTMSPIKDATAFVTGVSVIARDITDRKRAEEALIAEEHLLHTLMDNLPDAIYFKDRESHFTRTNKAHAKQFGLSDPAQAVGETDFDFFTQEHAQEAYNDEQEIIRTGQPVVNKEERETWPDGRVTWVSTTKMPLRDAHGNIIGTFGVSRDITQHKQAEAEHARLVTAIEQSAEAVVITNTTGDIEYVNPAFTRITGYGRKEVLGQNPRILKSDKQDPEFYQQLWATILNGQTWHGELINRRKDGSLYTEEMNIAPVRNQLGEITHFIATKQDVTEHKQLEQQLIQAQKMEAVGRLAGGVAHDFNNLLTIINGYAQLLIEPISPQDPRRGHLKEILMAGERAASLTRQLLAFSRRQVLEPRVLNLNSVLADVAKMLRRLIGEDVELVSTLKPDLGRVKVDPGQIEQVIMNLAVNARDAMPQGGKLFIETSNVEIDANYARRHSPMMPGKYVMVAVSDTGCGMDLETQAHAFEPFFTTKEKGHGTGLGLATVYGIVKQSGGFIWVYSAPGHGSTFKIYLPFIEEALPTAEPAEAPAELAKGSETVLVVEDERGVRSLVCEALASHGYKVLEAAGAASALEISERYTEPIHLLLTDVVMPQTGGKELAKGFSTLHPETKVLYMSGYTDDAIVRHGILEGGTSFLQKPFQPKALLLKIREVLKMKSGTQQF